MSTSPESIPAVPGDAIDFAANSPPKQESAPEQSSPSVNVPRLPSLRPDTEHAASMTASSTPLGILQNARRPIPPPAVNSPRGPPPRAGGAQLPASMQERMKAFHLSRQGAPPARPTVGTTTVSTGSVPESPGGFGGAAGLRLPPNMRPTAPTFVSAPAVPKMPKMGGGLSARRGMKLPGGLPGGLPGSPVSNGTSTPAAENGTPAQSSKPESLFNKYSEIVDTQNGTLKFAGKAVIRGDGIDFTSGSTFNISLDEVDTLDELGKGNYGTVYKVRHARPRIRRPGLGLAGNKVNSSNPLDKESDIVESLPKTGSTTGMVMAMKEIRLELDEAKFNAIIMELDTLHRCVSPYIIDFYGAFFQEGAVYICIEFMDGGSIDKIYGDGVPENICRKITYATVQGLKTLKDDHNIIHRDVKPTNILVNTRGQIKICDFGVSGNLVASIAKTNIGCQSYMAPERISGGGMPSAGAIPEGTYGVQSDIWSLGLSIIECAMGRYPYPPETYNNIFSQLQAIVEGEPPDLPEEGFSPLARDFVRGCLNKIPNLRPSYGLLLQHGWLAELSKPAVISEEDEDEDADVATSDLGSSGTEDAEVAAWVLNAIDRKKKGLIGESQKPALHAAPLDAVSPVSSPQ